MIKQWETFRVGPKDGANELHVSLDPKGNITIGAKAFEKFKRPAARAVLMFDKINSLIGIVPASSRADHAYPMIEKKNGRHRTLRAGRFCRHYGISVERTVAFNKAEIDDDGVLVLNLAATRVIGKRQ